MPSATRKAPHATTSLPVPRETLFATALAERVRDALLLLLINRRIAEIIAAIEQFCLLWRNSQFPACHTAHARPAHPAPAGPSSNAISTATPACAQSGAQSGAQSAGMPKFCRAPARHLQAAPGPTPAIGAVASSRPAHRDAVAHLPRPRPATALPRLHRAARACAIPYHPRCAQQGPVPRPPSIFSAYPKLCVFAPKMLR